MHKASPYDFYGIFAHAKGPVTTVGTYFMYVRKTQLIIVGNQISLPYERAAIGNRRLSRASLEEIGKGRRVVEEEHVRNLTDIIVGRAKQFAYLIKQEVVEIGVHRLSRHFLHRA